MFKVENLPLKTAMFKVENLTLKTATFKSFEFNKFVISVACILNSMLNF